MSRPARGAWTALWAASWLLVLLGLGACATSGGAVIAAQQAKLPAAPPALSKDCPAPPPVMAGDDLRRALDGALIWGNCAAAEVTAWQRFYANLRGGK